MKKSIFLFGVAVMISLLSLPACKKDNPEPSAQCKTENMSFANDVMPIMNSSCNTTNWHDNITAAANIRLDTFPGVRDNTDKIIQAINHDAGAKAMPLPSGTEKLSDCNIDKITAWVTQGKKNN